MQSNEIVKYFTNYKSLQQIPPHNSLDLTNDKSIMVQLQHIDAAFLQSEQRESKENLSIQTKERKQRMIGQRPWAETECMQSC